MESRILLMPHKSRWNSQGTNQTKVSARGAELRGTFCGGSMNMRTFNSGWKNFYEKQLHSRFDIMNMQKKGTIQ